MNAIKLLFLVCLCSSAAAAQVNCVRPELAHQSRDVATIQRLEKAWTLAYLSGDTEFERCLLTSDFMEIMKDGSINRLSEELALAAKNKGKNVTNPPMAPESFHLHDNVAVAYGVLSDKPGDGNPRKMYFVDYYVWANGSWHVFFAQQTSYT